MLEASPVTTPMQTSCKITKTGSAAMVDPYMYRSVVGALQYATITRPDISYSVNKVCQFMDHPLEAHWVAVRRILRYLKGTIDHGLLLSPLPTMSSLLLPFRYFVMQIGPLILMPEGALLVQLSFLALISSLGGLESNKRLLDLALRLSTEALVRLLQTSFGSRLLRN